MTKNSGANAALRHHHSGAVVKNNLHATRSTDAENDPNPSTAENRPPDAGEENGGKEEKCTATKATRCQTQPRPCEKPESQSWLPQKED